MIIFQPLHWRRPLRTLCAVGAGLLVNALDAAELDKSKLPPAAVMKVDFARDVQPLFAKHCYSCHGAEKQKGGFRLDVKNAAFTSGDEHAPNIISRKSADSPLIHFVAGLVEDLVMPAKGERLTSAQISLLRAWIDQGAPWPEPVGAKSENPLDWWSLKPLVRPVVPLLSSAEFRVQNPVDAFITAKLKPQKLPQSPAADARTLVRRLYFDLQGLPPKPEEIEAFVAAWPTGNDVAARKIQNIKLAALTEQLLASPHYGERWARHWLDVVHYGDTHGYDKDKPRPNAWPYRDYVIRAFNADKSYARFVQEQIAGDVLFPGTRDGIEALGFIAAGPWDFIGHAEVPESKIDGKIARHLDRDDMIVNTIGTFNSLTIQCAQCHNHKFDPIPQVDYYRLQAVFAALDRADKKYFTDPQLTERFAALEHRQRTLNDQKKALETKLEKAAGQELKDLDQQIENTKRRVQGNARAEFGYHSAIATTPETVKWVQVDLGRSVAIERVVLAPCYDDFNQIGAGFGFPVRFKIEASDDVEFKTGVTLFWRKHDQTFMNDFPNPGLKLFSVNGAGGGDIKGRYVRVTATKLAPRQNDFIFAISELQVFDAAGKNLAASVPVMALDSIEAGPRWAKKNLTDGIFPAPDDPTGSSVVELKARRETLLAHAGDDAMRVELAQLKRDLTEVSAELKTFPAPNVVFAGTVHYGSGAFAGTGANGGQPRVIRVLHRGDVKQPKDEVMPGALSCVTTTAQLTLPPDATDGARRAALAQWLSDTNNPLTWRSMANRVWQYHFGRGLVETPNDFGHMGALPTHPELLDWLACELRDHGGSLKKLHQLIVSSATYQQSSAIANYSMSTQLDGDNRFLWRQNRRKLEAEAVHDSVLLVSGKLDVKMGGPAFQDFIIEKPEHSPHYEYRLHDPDNPQSHRRSIYRFLVRSQTQPFMTTLDCADPSMQVGKRNESLSALQALALLNNGFMVVMAKHFAEKVDAAGGDLPTKIDRAFRTALARVPTTAEKQALTLYAQKHGLVNACRVIFNLNEFAFVD